MRSGVEAKGNFINNVENHAKKSPKPLCPRSAQGTAHSSPKTSFNVGPLSLAFKAFDILPDLLALLFFTHHHP